MDKINQTSKASKPSDSFIACRLILSGVKLHHGLIARAVIYLSALNSALYLVGMLPNMNAMFDFVFTSVVTVIEFISYAWVGWLIAKYRKNEKHAFERFLIPISSGLIIGVFLGIYVALFKIFMFMETWTIVNMFIEPIAHGSEGAIFAGIASIVSGIFYSTEDSSTQNQSI